MDSAKFTAADIRLDIVTDCVTGGFSARKLNLLGNCSGKAIRRENYREFLFLSAKLYFSLAINWCARYKNEESGNTGRENPIHTERIDFTRPMLFWLHTNRRQGTTSRNHLSLRVPTLASPFTGTWGRPNGGKTAPQDLRSRTEN